MNASPRTPGRAVAHRAVLLLATAATTVTVATVSACEADSSAGGPPVRDVPTPSASASPAARCPASGVIITAGPVDAAMGLRAMGVDLLNCGTAPYTVQGYPVVRVLDEHRRPLQVGVLEGTGTISRIERYEGRPQRVTAAPGGRLAAVVVWRNTVTDTQVTATTARYLEIAPAAGRPSGTVAPSGGIDLGNTGRLAVSRWITPPAG